MAPSKWRTECVGEGQEKELTSQDSDDVKKLNGRCEEVTEAVKERCEDKTEADKENQGNGEMQVVLTRLREKRRPPSLTIVEPEEDESGTDGRLPEVDQLDNQLVLGLANLKLATTPCLQATVQEGGFVRLTLSHGVTVDVTPEQAFRVSNPFQESSIAISSCGRQIAFVHPAGRLLQYGPRIELQVEDPMSVKNAKIWPKGISFTATAFALVYLLDEAGLRTTSDVFHDLGASDIVDSLWEEEVWSRCMFTSGIREGKEMLEGIRRWRSGAMDCWEVAGIRVEQGEDGLVRVERLNRGDTLMVRTSPTNGRIKVTSEFLFATASRGDEGHVYIRSGSRRIHYSAVDTAFTVRQEGKSGGFDGDGFLRIY